MTYDEFKNQYPIGALIKYLPIPNAILLADNIWNMTVGQGLVYKILGHMGHSVNLFKVLVSIDSFDPVICKLSQDFLQDQHLLDFKTDRLPYIVIVNSTKSPMSPAELAAHFPHVCPKCGAPAYVGFYKTDCSANCS